MSPQEEARRMLALVNGELSRAVRMLEEQLNVLHTRAQVLLTLAGAVITVTGFSGRLIAATGPWGKASVITGLFVVIASAAWVFSTVMSVKWVSTDLADSAESTLLVLIHRRNQKTRAYKIGGLLLCAGLAIYGIAVSLMLAGPTAAG